MIDSIRTVAVLGAGGTIGALTGGIVAQSGRKVYLLSRHKERAETGLVRAMDQARSDVIARNVVCGDYDAMLEQAVGESDWVIECVSEDIAVKKPLFDAVERFRKPDAVVSSTTSSLPLRLLCEGRSGSFRAHFLGVHLFNPPSKLTACEVAGHADTDPEVLALMKGFLARELGREVVEVRDAPGYAGNRIAFLVMCEVARLAAGKGVAVMDCLVGPYTGRAMAPLATLDLVGLDIFRAIIENLTRYTTGPMHDSFVVPGYVNEMIAKGLLGNKTPERGGFYLRIQDEREPMVIDPVALHHQRAPRPRFGFVDEAAGKIRLGLYREAFDAIRRADAPEADLVRKVLATYVAYACHCVGEVSPAEVGLESIDRVMAHGFRWAPPSVVLDLLGGPEEMREMLVRYGIPVPDRLAALPRKERNLADFGQYFVAR